MDITEVSIMHHVCIVLLVLWLLSKLNWCHPIAYFISLIYLYLVHENYVTRLRKKIQFEEKRQSNQRRVLTDSETVRWLNHAVEKIWPVCMEQIASQKILLPIIPWFLEKYKPWTAKEALVQQLYLGRNPPLFTEIRVLRQSSDDDHLVLELGMDFLTAEDMSAILAVKLRKRLGFGMWAKLHLTGMHVEGKVLIGVKFIRKWPFLGRLRVCFAEPPYFQMTVKPIFTHGINVTEVPGIAGWLDKLLSVAFEETLVEPNMLVVDMEKFASPQQEDWFSVDVKEPIAYVRVEVIEASDMKPSDLNGLADPYVIGQMGPYRFKTQIQKKTLAPKWLEEFKIPIITWETPNVLKLEVCDKDHLFDDSLGNCSMNVNDLRDGQRHDTWVSLENIKKGRLHIAITVIEESEKDVQPEDREPENKEEKIDTFASDAANKGSSGETLTKDCKSSFASDTTSKSSLSSLPSGKSLIVQDKFEPINIDGQKETGVWIHQPGSEISQTWKPRKGRSRRVDTHIQGECNDASGSVSPSIDGDNGDKHLNPFQKGFNKINSVFHRNPRGDRPNHDGEDIWSPHANIRAVDSKKIGVQYVVDDGVKTSKERISPEESSSDTPGKGNVKGMAKSLLKQARSIKHALSRKGSVISRGDASIEATGDIGSDSDSSDDPSLSSFDASGQTIPISSHPILSASATNSPTSKGSRVSTDSSDNMGESGYGSRTQGSESVDDVNTASSDKLADSESTAEDKPNSRPSDKNLGDGKTSKLR